MQAYATVAQLEQLIGETDDTRAGVLLEHASLIMDAEMRNYGIVPATIDADILKTVCIRMVARVIDKEKYMGVSSSGFTVGAVSQTFTYANPSGSLYLDRAERVLLGIERMKHRAEWKPLSGVETVAPNE